MERNEFLLVAAALVITGALKVAEMPVKAISYFGNNPVVMAMTLPKLPVMADVPAAPEMPQMAMAASETPEVALQLPALPAEALQVHVSGVPTPKEIEKIQADVAREVKRAKCQAHKNAIAAAHSREFDVRINDTVKRALAQTSDLWKGAPSSE